MPNKHDKKSGSRSHTRWTAKEVTVMMFYLSHGFKLDVVSSLMVAVCETPQRDHSQMKGKIKAYMKRESKEGTNESYEKGKMSSKGGAPTLGKFDQDQILASLVKYCMEKLSLSDEAEANRVIQNLIQLKPDHLQILREDETAFEAFARDRPNIVKTQAQILPYSTTDSGGAYQGGGSSPTRYSYPVGQISHMQSVPKGWSMLATPIHESKTETASSNHNRLRRAAPEDDESIEEPQPPRKIRPNPYGAAGSAQTEPDNVHASMSTSEGTDPEYYQIALKWSRGDDMDEASCRRWALILGGLPEYGWAWTEREKVKDRICAENGRNPYLWIELEWQEIGYWLAQNLTWQKISEKFPHHPASGPEHEWRRYMDLDEKYNWVWDVRQVVIDYSEGGRRAQQWQEALDF